jgi:acetyltransferase-like isoleucine patch superfamily enzyme
MKITTFNKPWVGVGTYVGADFQIHGDVEEKKVTIGKYCSIASYVRILTGGGHDYHKVSTYPFQYSEEFGKECSGWKPFQTEAPVIIKNDVWIGMGAQIHGGVTIGNGAVVGMGAVVVKDVPAYAIVGGVPAKVIDYRFNAEISVEMENIAWWDWPEEELRKAIPLMDNPAKFVAEFGRKRSYLFP